MFIMKKLMFVFIICVPLTAWGSNFHYSLNVRIHPGTSKVIGTARLKADGDIKIELLVRHLKALKVDGMDIESEDEHLSLSLQKNKETLVSYEAWFAEKGINLIDKKNVSLVSDWYPLPDVLTDYALSVTLPSDFIAVSEADSVKIQLHDSTKTYMFQFNHPLDSLHLVASTRYILKKDRYNDISVETYFFKEDAQLADQYIAYTKKYLAMYETMLTPYPYNRFAVVENILPTGNSMPTFTLLGNQVLRLPFIVKTSLGHEILHQWFGNSVYIDFAFGNWSEGITTYLADQHYAALEGKGAVYRKQLLVDYNDYVNRENVISLYAFKSRYNKAQSAIGYGKCAMVFHMLRKRYGDEMFFNALRTFVQRNLFREASWHDIQRAFEKVTGEELYTYFRDWLTRKNIPGLEVENADLRVEEGQLKLNFALTQSSEFYPLRIPITLFFGSDKQPRIVEMKKPEENISLTLSEPPTKVFIDKNYDLMRQLIPKEIPPVLAGIMGKEKLTAVISFGRRSTYQPLIDALGVENITYMTPNEINFDRIQNNSLLIAGYNNALVNRLFGKQPVPTDDIHVKIYKNPYNLAQYIALLYAKNKNKALAIQRKISHYGKYTELGFKNGLNTFKRIAKTENGIEVLSRPADLAITPGTLNTIDDIVPHIMDSRIIYVGEKHDRFAHHINQLSVIKKLHEAGYQIAVGMEMFQKPFQGVINDYLAGRIDEHTFLKKSEYFSRWRYDYNLYKPIIDYLKQENIPMVALNINSDISRDVARKGIYGLSDKQKKRLPSEMNFSNEQYREDLDDIFTMHNKQQGLHNSNYFLQAQTLWDEGMAESAQEFMMKHPDKKLVILAGNGHLRHKYGIPERLYRRNHEPFTVIVQDEEIEGGIADYVLLTTKIAGRKSPKLGVAVEEKNHGLEIVGINHHGPAKKAGLEKGDVIKTFAGRPISSLADLKLELFYSKFGSTVKIQVERENETLNKEIELFNSEKLPQ